ncbi:uncharacterized protein B0J16DRAFT_348792 [Fusarium flagelliforme]|uniref:Uncharacterized protein n=1 Tax=Fusarium flagelliforme TaxID=2675880 RepID=A0A395MII6_9HYPO|nr:uncharacterized protein B0J16DRAFT_348792 [Fusarium flagelliforme]KAH7174559.1 hypothetical protein B0J16DRAFT_348792 [Fusarium flagelliforme]RFN47748.1 hypothetical protein FIE12Z_8022 [Fusarium flagelliforme]
MRAFGPCYIITLAANLAVASVCKPRSFTNSFIKSVIPTTSNVLSATTTAVVETNTMTTAVDMTLTSRFPTTSDDDTSAVATETEAYVSESLFTTSVETTRAPDPTTALQSATTGDSSITLDATTSIATTTSESASEPIPTSNIVASGGAVDGKILTSNPGMYYHMGFDMNEEVSMTPLKYQMESTTGYLREASGSYLCIVNGPRQTLYTVTNCPPNTIVEFGSVSLISCLRSIDNKLNCHAPLEDCPWGGSCTPIEDTVGLFYWMWAPWGKTLYMGLTGVSQPPEGMNPIELQLSEL